MRSEIIESGRIPEGGGPAVTRAKLVYTDAAGATQVIRFASVSFLAVHRHDSASEPDANGVITVTPTGTGEVVVRGVMANRTAGA